MSKRFLIPNSLFLIPVIAALFLIPNSLFIAKAFIGPTVGCVPGSASGCGSSFSIDASGNVGFGTGKISGLGSSFNTPPTGSFQNVFMVASTSTPPGIALRNIGSGGSANGGYGLADATWVWQLTPWGAMTLTNAGASYSYNRNAMTIFPDNRVVFPGPFGSGSGWYPATSTLNVIGDITGTGNVNITGSFVGSLSGNLSATNISGPSAFGSNYGTYNYAFPGAIAVGTSTTSNLPQPLSVYGGGYFSGNVGIGNSNPTVKLSINGAAYGNTLIRLQNVSAGYWDISTSYNYTDEDLFFGANGTNVIEFSNLGNVGLGYVGVNLSGGKLLVNGSVGVGTTTPSRKLTVVSTSTADGILISDTDATSYGTINFLNTSGITISRIHSFNPSWTSASGAWKANGFALANNSQGISLVADGATGTIRLFTGGNGDANERMRIDSAGNVGISTTTPAYPLTVAGTIYSTTGGYRFPDGTTQTTAFAGGTQVTNASYVSAGVFGSNSTKGNFEFQHSNTTSSVMYVDATNDRVGIGTAGPAQALDVSQTTAQGVPQIIARSTGGTAATANAIGFISGAASDWVGKIGHLGLNNDWSLDVWTDENAPIRFWTGGTEKMQISSGGNVGIGTAAPGIGDQTYNAPLTVYSTVQAGTFIAIKNTDATYKFGGVWLQENTSNAGWLFGTEDNGKAVIRYGTGASETAALGSTRTNSTGITIDTTGKVGIATTTPSFVLDVSGNPRFDGTGATLGNNNSYILDWAPNSTNSASTFTLRNGVNTGATTNIKFSQRGSSPWFKPVVGIGIDPVQASTLIVAGADTSNSLFGLQVSDSAGSVKFAVRNDGNVGIATTTPAYPLTVAGTIYSTTGGVRFPDGTTQTTAYGGGTQVINASYVSAGTFGSNSGGGSYLFGTSTLKIDDTNQRVGIGTAGPLNKLSVTAGNISVDNTLSVGGADGNGLRLSTEYSTDARAVFLKPFVPAGSGGIDAAGLKIITNNSGVTPVVAMTFLPGGNVGIGTTGPAEKLEVAGNIQAINAGKIGFRYSAANNGMFAYMTSAEASPLTLVGGTYTSSPTAVGLLFQTAVSYTPTNAMAILNNGNVGIGTTGPRAKLDVSDGTVNTTGEAIFQGLFTGPTRTFATDATAILTIQSNDAMAINKGGSIAFGGRAITASDAGANWAGISGFKENATTANYLGYLAFYTRGSDINERMRIDSSGNVGIATTTPAYPLTVAGTIYSSTGGYRFPDGTTQTTAFAGGSQTINASYVSSGVFGSNSAKGNFEFQHSNTTANVMYIDATNDRVGIGTASPGVKLDVQGGRTYLTASSEAYALKLTRSDIAGGQGVYIGASTVSITPSGSLFNNGGTAVLTWQDNGNVGIGTTAPAGRLQVGTVAFPSPNTTYNQQFVGITNIMGRDSGEDSYIGNNVYYSSTPNWRRAIAGGAGLISFGSVEAGAIQFSNAVSGAGQSVPTWVDSMTIRASGNVGIGTTAPASVLSVAGVSATVPVSTPSWNSSGFAIFGPNVGSGTGAALGLGYNSTNGAYIYSLAPNVAWKPLTINASTFSVVSGVATQGLYQDGTGNVGIGNTNPTTARLVITPGAQPAIDVGSQKIIGLGYPAISTDAASVQYVSDAITNAVGGTSTSTGSYVLKSGDTMSGNLNMGGNNISGVNKLYVTTIDPVYQIGGTKYATYVSNTIGQKEEMYGKAELVRNNESGIKNYEYIIDFNNVDKGSDLWLFWQTIAEGKNMKDIQVLLTPQFNGRAWYELKPAQKQIVVFGEPSNLEISKSRNLEISYHLVAPRHDASEWLNQIETNEKGIPLNIK